MKFMTCVSIFFAVHLASAASVTHTSASLLCEETGTQTVKVRIALLGRGTTALLLKHGADKDDIDTVLRSERVIEITETALRTTIKANGVFEWNWIRKPGTPGYKGTLQIFTDVAGWPANSTSIEMNCSLDSPFSYYL